MNQNGASEIKIGPALGVILPRLSLAHWTPSAEQIFTAEKILEAHFKKGFSPDLPIHYGEHIFKDLQGMRDYFRKHPDTAATHWLALVDHEIGRYQAVAQKWTSYRRQYRGEYKDKRKVILISFLTGQYPRWKEDFVMVKDGGTDFLEVTWDPTEQKVLRIYIHGEA